MPRLIENVLIIGYVTNEDKGFKDEPVMAIMDYPDILTFSAEDDVPKELANILGLEKTNLTYPSELRDTVDPDQRSEMIIYPCEYGNQKVFLVIVSPSCRSKIRENVDNDLSWPDQQKIQKRLNLERSKRKENFLRLLEIFKWHKSVSILYRAVTKEKNK